MFKDKYKNEMNQIMPDEKSVKNLKKNLKNDHYSNKLRTYPRIILAMSLVMVLMATTFTTYIFINKGNQLIGESDNDTSIVKIVDNLTYADIYAKLSSSKRSGSNNFNGSPTNDVAQGEVDAEVPTSENKGNNNTPDHSNTNIQVEGVDEADIVKTDGNYIYAVFNSSVYIYKVENGKLTKVSVILGKGTSTDNTTYPGKPDSGYGTTVSAGSTEPAPADVSAYVKTESAYIGPTETSGMTIDSSAVAPDGSGIVDEGKVIDYYYTNNILEIYVYNDILVIIRNSQTYNNYYGVAAEIYNVSDREKPEIVDTVIVDGNYSSTRMIDNQLYIVSTKYANYASTVEDIRAYVPYTYAEGESKPVSVDDIIMPDDISTSIYSVITSIDVTGDVNLTSQKAVLGCSSSVYVNLDSMYFSSYSMYDYKTVMFENQPDESTVNSLQSDMGTAIIKLGLNDGKVNLAATGLVKGYINNQFSMDENNGYFRVATTSYDYKLYSSGQAIDLYNNDMKVADTRSIYYWGNTGLSKNNVYIMKQDGDKLVVKGKVEGLAEGERIYSVRFDGDIGYIVTFRQMDPLFAVDLSNPEAPKLLSELKIPGYSTYMHVYSDKLLFGFGVAAETSGAQTGLKLSMFDVSDKTNVTEKSSKTLDGYYYSEALYNHKAILVDPERKLIGFAAFTNNYTETGYNYTNTYNLYTYDDTTGFKELAVLSLDELNNYYNYGSNIRGLFIGDYFYVVGSGNIVSFSLSTYEKIDTASFVN